eukprot:scaffold204321_cov30-Tisochrysis_lutea.AAC.5
MPVRGSTRMEWPITVGVGQWWFTSGGATGRDGGIGGWGVQRAGRGLERARCAKTRAVGVEKCAGLAEDLSPCRAPHLGEWGGRVRKRQEAPRRGGALQYEDGHSEA